MNNRIPHLLLIDNHLAGISLPVQESNLQIVELTYHYRVIIQPPEGSGQVKEDIR